MTTKKKSTTKPRKKPAASKETGEPSALRASLERSAPLALVIVGALGLALFGAHVLGDRGGRGTSGPVEEEVEVVHATPVVPERLIARVHARYPHRTDAYTQGFVWESGRLFESTGLVGRSSLREVELATGVVSRFSRNTDEVFAEGLALVGDRLVQLTWQDHVAYVYTRDGFEQVGQHRYEGEGWGLCYDGSALVMSDGSDVLRFRDPETFEVRRSVSVRRLGRPLRMLNELECVGEKVYANVWQTNDIVRIDAGTGVVEAIIDARALAAEVAGPGVDVLNGIAYLPERGRFLVTGKLWPTVFEVTFEPARGRR